MVDDLDHIGQWMARFRESGDPDLDEPLTKWHRVETRVEDRFGTHCGRQMGEIDGTVLIFRDFVDLEDRCQRD